MTRTLSLACLLSFFLILPAFSQEKGAIPQQRQSPSKPGQSTTPSAAPDEENPPEEDESVAPEKYTLDPLESDRNIKVGNFYWHKGKYRPALQRYERATRYNPNSAEAFFKVGEAEEKLNNKDAAKLAFQKVVQIAPDTKLAQDAKKKLSKN